MPAEPNTELSHVQRKVSPSAQAKRSDAKLIALDVDGTLVNQNGELSPAVYQAVREVAAAGHEVVIATGRSLRATLPVLDALDIAESYLVCGNGAILAQRHGREPAEAEILTKHTFNPREALFSLAERLPDAMYAVETAAGDFLSTQSFQDRSFGIHAREVKFEQLLDQEAVRLVVYSQDTSYPEFEQLVAAVGLHSVAYSIGWSCWLDIAAPGITKASALEELRQHLGFAPEATVAAGDGLNDVQMLQWAHRSVAMGQASEAVQAAATEVTASVHDDGLAPVLHSLLSE